MLSFWRNSKSVKVERTSRRVSSGALWWWWWCQQVVGSGRLDAVLLLGFLNCFSVYVLSCDAEGLKRHRSWGVMWESLIWSFRCFFPPLGWAAHRTGTARWTCYTSVSKQGPVCTQTSLMIVQRNSNVHWMNSQEHSIYYPSYWCVSGAHR